MHLSAEACAKVNLTLDIVGKRVDGYHLLQTIMQSVSLSDTVSIWPEESGIISVTCTWEEVPCDEKNTAYRAALAFFDAVGIHHEGLGICLKKRIPFGAGLGGGSADAAAVLRLLDILYETELSDAELVDIGGHVGADVPFCLIGGTMLAEGTGNILTPLSDLEDCCFVIVKPDNHVSTTEAYQKWDSTEVLWRPDTNKAAEAVFAHDFHALGEECCNVFEQITVNEERETIKQVMREYSALGTAMSGSGSSIFGLFEDKSDAEVCKRHLEDDYSHVYLCYPSTKGVILS